MYHGFSLSRPVCVCVCVCAPWYNVAKPAAGFCHNYCHVCCYRSLLMWWWCCVRQQCIAAPQRWIQPQTPSGYNDGNGNANVNVATNVTTSVCLPSRTHKKDRTTKHRKKWDVNFKFKASYSEKKFKRVFCKVLIALWHCTLKLFHYKDKHVESCNNIWTLYLKMC